MAVTFKQFAEVCEGEGVTLEPPIVEAGQSNMVSERHSLYDEAPCMAPIIEAGILLRAEPDIALANQVIRQTFPRGTLASALRTVINSTVEYRRAGLVVADTPSLDVCHDAETYFMSLFLNMEREDSPRCDIFTKDSKPLFVRKRGLGVPSTISLASISLNHVSYPAFSLFRLEAEGDEWFVDDEEIHRLRSGSREMSVRDVGDITGASFLRPSVFSVSPRERFEHFGGYVSPAAEEFSTRKLCLRIASIVAKSSVGVA